MHVSLIEYGLSRYTEFFMTKMSRWYVRGYAGRTICNCCLTRSNSTKHFVYVCKLEQ